MKTIRWIHFSDLHLNIQNVETRLLRRGLMEYLRKHEICCDYAFCSGDLRNAPDKSFPENTVDLIKDICESVGVSLDNLYIVPGNHDINRDVEDREKTIGKILGGNKYGKGYYKPEEGIIAEEDLTIIKSGQNEFLKLMEAVYKDRPERINKYRGLSHFVIETEDINIVHLDSTITYGKSFESDLVIGTNQLYSVLDSINPQKHTVLLTHYPFDRLMPEERTELLEVMRQHDVKLWLSGHLHDVLVQKRQDYFYEFQCGNYVSDGGKSTVLLGELNLETGNGNVECLLWQKGDGWFLNQYLNKSSIGDKSKYLYELTLNDAMMVNQLDNTKINSDIDRTIYKKLGKVYDLRYHVKYNARYGMYNYPLVAKAILPSQQDTVFWAVKIKSKEYNSSCMMEWLKQIYTLLINYNQVMNYSAIGFLYIQITEPSLVEKEDIIRSDFLALYAKEYKTVNLALKIEDGSLIKEDILIDKKYYIESITVVENSKEVKRYYNDLLIGDMSLNQPNIQESYPSLRILINEIQQYYQKKLKVWDEMLNDYCSFLKDEDLEKYDEYALNHIKYSDGLVYEITFNKYGIFCIKFDGYLYTGGAHGIPYRHCIIFDLNTGKKKKLSEIVSYTYEELLPRVYESLFLRHSDGNHEMANIYLERVKKKYHTIDEFKYFLTEDCIVIYFDVYEISDYSRRYMELFIDFTDDLFLRQEIPENSIIIKSQKLRLNVL